MKFVSFNINGIRAHMHQLKVIINTLKPNIISLQETKVHDDIFPIKEILSYGYYAYYYGQKNHYGVALLSLQQLQNIRKGFSPDNNQEQCRMIMADYILSKSTITIINGYFPQGGNSNHPIKFPAKKKFYYDLQNYIEKNYNKQALIIIMGDMNISPTDLDIGIGEENRKRWIKMHKCSFLPDEREWIKRLLEWGFIDTYRQNHPNNNCYSWFDYRSHGFEKNRGLRIDLLLASKQLANKTKATGIDYSIRGMKKPSDHAPVWVDFDL